MIIHAVAGEANIEISAVALVNGLPPTDTISTVELRVRRTTEPHQEHHILGDSEDDGTDKLLTATLPDTADWTPGVYDARFWVTFEGGSVAAFPQREAHRLILAQK